MKIKQLSPHEAQKIAAGEVVERPANIVKELLENALDAGATAITVYIEDGGKRLIKIVDNGCGMSPEDARMCIKHHATSKITTVADLEHISTFGFRGEALSSIAAVSKLVITTKEAATAAGITLEIDQSVIYTERPAACNTGTSITVQDIFYALPARKKFLKSRDTEWRMILQLFFAFCLDYPDVYFKLYSDDSLVYNCPHTADITVRITQLYEHALTQHILLCQAHETRMNTKITLAFSDPEYTRYDRSQIFVFVNKRWVKNHKLVQAFIKGYQNMLPTGKYPAGFLFITLDTHCVDNNIHPRKEEVQFLHPKIIESLIESGVKKRLEEYTNTTLGAHLPARPTTLLSPSDSPTSPTSLPSSWPASTFSDYTQSSNTSFTPASFTSEYTLARIFGLPDKQPDQQTNYQSTNISSPVTQVAANQPMQNFTTSDIAQQIAVFTQSALQYTLIGQVLRTYIIIEVSDGLTLIDQHAAHERILYEKFKSKFDTPESVTLVFPEVITLNTADITLLEPHLPLCTQYGLIINKISDTQLVVEQTPVYLKNQPLHDTIRQLIGWIPEAEQAEHETVQHILQEKLHAQLSCKAAVKAGDILTSTSMHQIIHDLYSLDTKLTCPHGRPTCWALTKQELEKKFKRTYK